MGENVYNEGNAERGVGGWLADGASGVGGFASSVLGNMWQGANGLAQSDDALAVGVPLAKSLGYLQHSPMASGYLNLDPTSMLTQGLEPYGDKLGMLGMLTGGVQLGSALYDYGAGNESWIDCLSSGVGGAASMVDGLAGMASFAGCSSGALGALAGAATPIGLIAGALSLASSGNDTVEDLGWFEDETGKKQSTYEEVGDIAGGTFDAVDSWFGEDDGGVMDWIGGGVGGVAGLGTGLVSGAAGTALNIGVGGVKAVTDLVGGAASVVGSVGSGIGSAASWVGSGISGLASDWW